ncbi:hypothetical protein BGZ68_009764, partial [Mortierella alpina]
TQAVLLAWLCHRYHDLASYASESLKQRIHFLAKPDGSNLQDLFIWDPPRSSSSSSSSTTTPLTALSWSSAQIQEYIHRHWSADQSPLNPPHPNSSWDSVPVFCKELDQETLHAMVLIGQQDHATVAVVLAVEEAESQAREGDKASSCWRYHNIVVIQESELTADGWLPISEFIALQKPVACDSLSTVEQEQVNGSDTAGDEEDSDDDYWGQYNDSEDDSAAEENATTTATATVAKKNGGDDKDDDDHKDEDEDEDEYWRKYAEQQEQQDRDERKKKMQDPHPAHHGLESTPTRDNNHEDLLSNVRHPASDQRSKSKIMDSLRSIVQDCDRAGFSKDEVFEMLQSVYSTSHLS